MFTDAKMCAHGHYKSPVCFLNMPYIKEVCLTKMQMKFTSNTNFVEIICPLIKYTNHDKICRGSAYVKKNMYMCDRLI